MGSGDLACFDFNGNPAWSLNLQKRYGKFRISYGMSSTPVLDGDRLYCQLIHGDGDASTHEAIVVALEKQTGKQVWKQTRISDAIVECEHSYASPMMYDDGKLKFLLSHGADYVVAHRLDDGAEIWRCGGLNPKEHYNPTLRLVASPATVPGPHHRAVGQERSGCRPASRRQGGRDRFEENLWSGSARETRPTFLPR